MSTLAWNLGLGGAFLFSASDQANPSVDFPHRLGSLLRRLEDIMSTTTLLIILLVVLLVGGGGFYGRGRWY